MRSRALAGREAGMTARRACMLRPWGVDSTVYVVSTEKRIESTIFNTCLYRGLRKGPARPDSRRLPARDSLRLTSRFRGLGRVRPGDAPEYRAVRQAGAAGVVEVENSADELSSRVQPRDGLSVSGHHLRVRIDAQPAETERDAAGYRVGLEGRGIKSVRPVRFIHRQSRGAAAVLD